jgi:hypothetical protein
MHGHAILPTHEFEQKIDWVAVIGPTHIKK